MTCTKISNVYRKLKPQNLNKIIMIPAGTVRDGGGVARNSRDRRKVSLIEKQFQMSF
jgi:hypothetical protein